MVQTFRETDSDTPVVLMGYLNPVEIMGYETFAQEAAAAGVDGVLTVDLPPEEGEVAIPAFTGNGLDPIFLIAPTTTDERMQKVCDAASGFVYYVSLKGVTGAATLDTAAVAEKVAQIRSHSDMPVGVGFGIKDADSAAAVGAVADAVVVGSALVNQVEANAVNPAAISPAICGILRSIRSALDAL
jgi:tryptophan synthase alpha chain